RGLRTAVRAAEVQEDHARARGLGQDLLALCHAIGDRDGAAYAHLRLANNANWTWQVQAAREHSAAAAALYDELGDRLGQASTLVCIGALARWIGDSQGAMAAFREAESIFRSLNDLDRQAIA